jgi:dTMP kinase
VHSSLAYQGEECDRDWVLEANRFARDADLTLYVDLPVDVCLDRIGVRNAARDIYERESFLERVRHGYEAAIALRPAGVVRIDGRGTIDEVHEAIIDAVRAAV